MKHLDLFSGIGGFALAAEWAGIETICFVERDDYCQRVLRKHWPDVPIIGDIQDVTKEVVENTIRTRLEEYGQRYSDIPERPSEARTGEESTKETLADATECNGQCIGTERRRQSETGMGSNPRTGGTADTDIPITLVTGGFPCQPVSVAGKRRGKEDDRWLWPEMLRVIREVKPAWVVGENVAGLIHMGLDDCLSDLENAGYEAQTFLIPACAVNAPHRRDRIFIVAYSTKFGNSSISNNGNCEPYQEPTRQSGRTGICKDVAVPNGERPQGHGELRECTGEWLTWTGSTPLEGIWKSEPPVGRVASRISSRVDRLKCLGNAVVPQVVYQILRNIVLIEMGVM